MADEKNDATPFIKNGASATITKTPVPPLPDKKSSQVARGKALKQVAASFVANLGTINTGMAFAYSSTTLAQLKAEGSFIHIDKSQSSWIASMSSLGTPFGCIISGYLMDNIGRRRTLIITEVPLILGWLTIAFAQNFAMILAGRFLVGFGSGMVGAPARVYTCEVSQPHLRGMLGALASVGVSTGVLIQYVIGSLTTWNVLAGINATIPMLALLGMLLLPETPNYLLQKVNRERAESSLVKLRGSTCNVDDEIQKMIAFKEKNHVEPLKGFKETIKALMSPSTLKPFSILAVYFFVYQWCGINTITAYATDIYKSFCTSADKNVLSITLGSIRLASTVVGCILCRRCGRRILTFISAAGCGITMIALAVYMYYAEYWQANGIPCEYTWIPIGSTYLFMIFCTLGYLIIPWVMIGEVYPTQVRGIVGGMTTCVAHLSVFSVVKSYEGLRDALNLSGVFALYGCLTLFGILFFYFFLPETKGRTLQEIEDYFSGRTKSLRRRNTQCEGA